MSGRHQWQLIVVDPEGIVGYLRGGVVGHETHERDGKLSIARMAPAIAERGNLLQCRGRSAENSTRNAQRRLVRRFLEPRGVPRKEPAVSRARVRSPKQQHGEG